MVLRSETGSEIENLIYQLGKGSGSARAAAAGRPVLSGKVVTGSDGEASATAAGATPGLVDVAELLGQS